MKRTMRSMLMVAAAAFMLAAAACDEENTGAPDGDTSIDTPADTGDVPTEGDAPPPACEEDFSPLDPEMRMVYFDLQAPTRLNNETLENIMLEGFANGDFNWLIDFDGVDDGSTDTDGTAHLFTGSGRLSGTSTMADKCFEFMNDARWPNAEADIAVSGDDISWPAAEPKIDIRVPVFQTNPDTGVKDLMLELPLKQVTVDSGTFSADRRAMGSPTSCTDGGGVLKGMITVEDAKTVIIEEMGLSLCGLLSGDRGSDMNSADDDCQRPIAEWSEQPDQELDGQPAFSMQACFSAEAVTIVGR
jgi:hypothetical protein